MQNERLLTPAEVCQILSVKVQTIYNWVHLKTFPHVKVGNRLRFSPTAVKAWIDEQTPELVKI